MRVIYIISSLINTGLLFHPRWNPHPHPHPHRVEPTALWFICDSKMMTRTMERQCLCPRVAWPRCPNWSHHRMQTNGGCCWLQPRPCHGDLQTKPQCWSWLIQPMIEGLLLNSPCIRSFYNIRVLDLIFLFRIDMRELCWWQMVTKTMQQTTRSFPHPHPWLCTVVVVSPNNTTSLIE